MTRTVVLGDGFAGVELIAEFPDFFESYLMGWRFSGYAAWLFRNAGHLYRLVGDSAIMRRPPRCAMCAARDHGRHRLDAA